jgi:hypothetical protein
MSLLVLNGFHQLYALHHIQVLGPNLYFKEPQLWNNGQIFCLDLQSFFTDVELPAQQWSEIKASKTPVDVENLQG